MDELSDARERAEKARLAHWTEATAFKNCVADCNRLEKTREDLQARADHTKGQVDEQVARAKNLKASADRADQWKAACTALVEAMEQKDALESARRALAIAQAAGKPPAEIAELEAKVQAAGDAFVGDDQLAKRTDAEKKARAAFDALQKKDGWEKELRDIQSKIPLEEQVLASLDEEAKASARKKQDKKKAVDDLKARQKELQDLIAGRAPGPGDG